MDPNEQTKIVKLLERAGSERQNKTAAYDPMIKTESTENALKMNIRDVNFWYSSLGART